MKECGRERKRIGEEKEMKKYNKKKQKRIFKKSLEKEKMHPYPICASRPVSAVKQRKHDKENAKVRKEKVKVYKRMIREEEKDAVHWLATSVHHKKTKKKMR